MNDLDLNGKLSIPKTLQWNNSANVLCNYMKKQEYLDRIIVQKAIIPRYVAEDISYLQIDGLDAICYPMTCFCDIPFSKVSSHMSVYGKYGIGIKKVSLLAKHPVQPVHYMNDNSELTRDFTSAFETLYGKEDVAKSAGILGDYLVSTLVFMKPIWGKQKNQHGRDISYIFQDECEWRYVPSTKRIGDLPLISIDAVNNLKLKEGYNKALARHKEAWLSFEWEDVSYIIVPNEVALNHTINTICSLKCSEREKRVIISKIEISKRFSSDR